MKRIMLPTLPLKRLSINRKPKGGKAVGFQSFRMRIF